MCLPISAAVERTLSGPVVTCTRFARVNLLEGMGVVGVGVGAGVGAGVGVGLGVGVGVIDGGVTGVTLPPIIYSYAPMSYEFPCGRSVAR